MKEQEFIITIQPGNRQIHAVEGDNLYTVLLVAGVIDPQDAQSEQLCLERGVVSPAMDAAAEEAVFSAAELTEGWMLASQRQVAGDAEILLHGDVQEELSEEQTALGSGYGMAFDLGTGTIAAGLVNLDNRRIPLMSACPSSQFAVAVNVRERLRLAAQDAQVLEELIRYLRNDIDELTSKLLRRAGITRASISTVMVAGSYSMISLLCGRLPQPDSGFAIGRVESCTAADLQLTMIPGDAQIYLLPSVSADIGGDMVAAGLAADLLHRKDDAHLTMLVDLSMEGDIMLAGRGHILACSVPSLPFEGEGVSCGMPAVTGAINAVQIDDLVTLKTVRDGRPKGVCGAGLISAVQCLRAHGLIDEEGRLMEPEDLPPRVAARFRATASGREFVLSQKDERFPRDISITQEDVLQMQLAKGTLYAACCALLSAMDADEEDIGEILLAESYRANLAPAAVLDLGLLPAVEANQVLSIGNSAWQGAYLALSSRRLLEETEALAAAIQPFDLSTDETYADEFIKAMNF